MAAPVKQKIAPEPNDTLIRRDYTAAVRYFNGRSELFHIRNADSFADARMMVENELTDARSIVIALRN